MEEWGEYVMEECEPARKSTDKKAYLCLQTIAHSNKIKERTMSNRQYAKTCINI